MLDVVITTTATPTTTTYMFKLALEKERKINFLRDGGTRDEREMSASAHYMSSIYACLHTYQGDRREIENN
jgi:hypothetical protein